EVAGRGRKEAVGRGVVPVRSLAQRDIDLDFLRVARRSCRASGDAEGTVQAVDPAGRPQKIAQRLRRPGFVPELANRPPRAKRFGQRAVAFEVRFDELDRLEPDAAGLALAALMHVRLQRECPLTRPDTRPSART